MVDALATQTSGPGHAVSIVLPSETMKPVTNFLIALILAMFFTLPFSIYAIVMVEVQSKRVDDLDRDARLEAYWLQRVETILQEKGVNVPPDPTTRKK
jgi:hypothetical protein